MKRFSTIVLASLVATTPVLNVYPNSDIPLFSNEKFPKIPDIRNLSYDEVMDLLALIESDSFEEGCSIDELEQVNRLISFLALEGAEDSEKIDVEMSIATLFKTDYCQYASWTNSNIEYAFKPAVFRLGSQNIVPCKSWVKKQWDQTREFVKKHKKAIIIGTIVVVAVTVVVVAAVAISTSAAGAAAGGIAASLDSNPPHQKDGKDDLKPSHEESLTSSLQEQIATFKETVAQEQLTAISDSSGISMEENGRIIGSLFTHKTVDTLTAQAQENPFLDYELQNLGFNLDCPTPKWASDTITSPHISTDLAFSTNYLPTYADSNTDLNTLTYQARGDFALSSGCYTQAVQDFGMAIEMNPNNPDSYLGRGLANFELGHYEESIIDYNNFVSQKTEPFSVTDFSVGFAKGLPQGIYDSGEGLLLFVTDLARHPIQTSEKVYESLSMLSRLAKSGEWNLVAEALSPELCQLISEWDTLSAKEKGELSGYAFGKGGADIFLPGAAAKAIAKGTAVARELSIVCKNLQSAEKVLVLEAIAEGGAAGVNVKEVVVSAQKALTAGEDLGLTTKEIAALKQSGELEQVIGKGRDFLAQNPELQASFNKFQKAQEFLQNYREFMPEAQARYLIDQSGIKTFPRPAGIPENFRVKISSEGAGIIYFHPKHSHTSIRLMPGKPHSPNPSQQKPYVVYKENGRILNKFGEAVDAKAPEAHIPLDEFVFPINR